MESREIYYIDGEDRHSVMAFEPLWQEVCATFEPQARVALILPCAWGKPWSQSYIARGILGNLITAFESYVVGLNAPGAVELRRSDILTHVDIWYMSSCGFVPMSMELFSMEVTRDELGAPFEFPKEYAFQAYNWDSARASAEDIEEWFRAAERRTAEWVSHFGKQYFATIVNLRSGSKSRQVWEPYLEREPQETDKFKVVNGYLESVVMDMHKDRYRSITLNGRSIDVDLPLLHPERIAYTSMVCALELLREKGLSGDVRPRDSD